VVAVLVRIVRQLRRRRLLVHRWVRHRKAVVEQCKRERYLEETALGVGKATGTRDPALRNDVRLPRVKEMLLGPTSAADFHSGRITAALFVL